MKHTARKLLALVMALAMLLSTFAVAEDGRQWIIGADGPIELDGEMGDGTGDPTDGMEIAMDRDDGLTDGSKVPAEGLDLGLDGNLAIDLDMDLDLDGEGLESLEGELFPVTEAAMNAGGDSGQPNGIFDLETLIKAHWKAALRSA